MVNRVARAGLGSISCPTASFCVPLGGDSKGPLAEEWNGRSWRVIPGALGGAAVVSCTSARFCMAVGATTCQPSPQRRPTSGTAPAGSG